MAVGPEGYPAAQSLARTPRWLQTTHTEPPPAHRTGRTMAMAWPACWSSAGVRRAKQTDARVPTSSSKYETPQTRRCRRFVTRTPSLLTSPYLAPTPPQHHDPECQQRHFLVRRHRRRTRRAGSALCRPHADGARLLARQVAGASCDTVAVAAAHASTPHARTSRRTQQHITDFPALA
jgi:hypothetical protein